MREGHEVFEPIKIFLRSSHAWCHENTLEAIIRAQSLWRNHSIGNKQSVHSAVQCSVYVYADLCSLLAATSQFSILIGQKMQLTGCRNGNEVRNATCVNTQISIEWPYCSFLYCGRNAYNLAIGSSQISKPVLYFVRLVVVW